MIKNLDGIHETVSYKENTNICLYNNDEYEAYPNHWHTPVEIIMPLEDTYDIIYGDTTTTLRENDILFICPGVLHMIPAHAGRRYIFQAEISSVLLLKELESVLTILSPAVLITPETTPDIYERMHTLMLEIAQEYQQAPAMYEAAIYSKLTEMIVALGRIHTDSRVHFDVSHSKQKEYIDKFMNICSYISDHCTEDLNLDKIASLSGFSKYHFTRLFKQFTNVSFYKYLNQKRIARAEQLLIDPTMSVTDVSLSCGFSSLSAFIRMFKIMKGCTPSEFRTMYDLP